MEKLEIIYLALSNLIINSSEALEGIKKLPLEQQNKEDIELLQYILSEAQILEEEYRKKIKGDVGISRPNWDEMEASQ